MRAGWFISFTPINGAVYAWATQTQPPRDADFAFMFAYPGTVHFAKGPTVEAARAELEADLRSAAAKWNAGQIDVYKKRGM